MEGILAGIMRTTRSPRDLVIAIRDNAQYFDALNLKLKVVLSKSFPVIYIAVCMKEYGVLSLLLENEVVESILESMKSDKSRFEEISRDPILQDILVRHNITTGSHIPEGEWETPGRTMSTAHHDIKSIERVLLSGNILQAENMIRSFRTIITGWEVALLRATPGILELLKERVARDENLSLLGHAVLDPVEEYGKYLDNSLERRYIINTVPKKIAALIGEDVFKRPDYAECLSLLSESEMANFIAKFEVVNINLYPNIAISIIELFLSLKNTQGSNLETLAKKLFSIPQSNPIFYEHGANVMVDLMYRFFKKGVPIYFLTENVQEIFTILKDRDIEKLRKYIISGKYIPQYHVNSVFMIKNLEKDDMHFIRTFLLDPIECTKETINQTSYSMTLSEVYLDLIDWYVYRDYMPFNQKINKHLPLDDRDKEHRRLFSELIENSPKTNKEVYLYRGIDAETPYDHYYFSKERKIKYILWRSISSCSQYREVSDTFNPNQCCMFIVQVPKDALAYDIVYFKNSEPEVLLPFDSLLEFVSESLQTNKDKRLIHVKYVGYINSKGEEVFFEPLESSLERAISEIKFKGYPAYVTNVKPGIFSLSSPVKDTDRVKKFVEQNPTSSTIYAFNKKFPEIGNGDAYDRIVFLRNYPGIPFDPASVDGGINEILRDCINLGRELTNEAVSHVEMSESEDDYFARFEGKLTPYIGYLSFYVYITKGIEPIIYPGVKDLEVVLYSVYKKTETKDEDGNSIGILLPPIDPIPRKALKNASLREIVGAIREIMITVSQTIPQKMQSLVFNAVFFENQVNSLLNIELIFQ